MICNICGLKIHFRNITFLSKQISWLFFLFLLWSCAKIGAPTGGKPDIAPPKLVKEVPKNNSTNFHGNKIVITFDEMIQLDNITQNLLISPPMAKMPQVIAAGNKIKISFEKNQLKDSTTYSFFFGKSIKDNNAGNVLQSFTYAFSTGSTIDTLRMSGTVNDAKTNAPLDDAYVMLYTNLNDSAPKKELPVFITKTDKKGSFEIRNIKKTKYRLYALKDENNDMKFNQSKEAFAFYDSIVTPNVIFNKRIDTVRCTKYDTISKKKIQVKDSLIAKGLKPCKDSIINKIDTTYLPKDLKLTSFIEEKKTQFLSGFSRDRREKIIFAFNMPLIKDSLIIEPLKISVLQSQIQKEVSPSKDTITYWLIDKSLRKNDSLKFVLHYFKHDTTGVLKWLTDTIKPRYEARKDKWKGQLTCLLTSSLKNNCVINANSPVSWNVSTPIKSVDQSKVTINLALDTNSIETTNNNFYVLDSVKKERYSTHSLPRIKQFSSKYFIDKQHIKTYKAGKNKFLLTFDKPLLPTDSISIRYEDKIQSSWLITERDVASNSLYCWITDKTLLSKKTFTFFVLFNGSVIDTLLFLRPKLSSLLPTSGGEEMIIPSTQTTSLCLDEMIPLYMINPIETFDTKGITLVKTGDTSKTPIPLTFKRYAKYPRTLFICAMNLEKATTYKLSVKEHSLTDIHGTYNIEQDFSIKTQQIQRNYILTPISDFKISTDSLSPRKQNLTAKWIEKKKYQIIVDPGAITDIYGNTNDSLKLMVSILSKEDYGTLYLTINGISKIPVIIQLWDKDEKNLIDWRYATENGIIVFKYLNPLEYKIKAIFDRNGNKKWDTGSFLEGIQPEKVQYKNDNITIKSGWENKVAWDLLELPKTTTPPNQIPEKKAK